MKQTGGGEKSWAKCYDWILLVVKHHLLFNINDET